MPSGRDSFRRNRVAPFVLSYFTTLDWSQADSSFSRSSSAFAIRNTRMAQNGYSDVGMNLLGAKPE